MRDFSWNYFSMTGDVESYLLYKEISDRQPTDVEDDEDAMPDQFDSLD